MNVRVGAGAREDRIRGWMESGELRITVSAPPEDGRANHAVTALLADALGVKTREVRLARGASSRRKSFEIEGLVEQEVRRRLDAAIAAGGAHAGGD